ncbi:hypothetical protein [Runella sp.]|uniref:hypothetical protein n=1 Tax=Runella sp. TaxID=1960881 RepID=UPI003D1207BB
MIAVHRLDIDNDSQNAIKIASAVYYGYLRLQAFVSKLSKAFILMIIGIPILILLISLSVPFLFISLLLLKFLNNRIKKSLRCDDIVLTKDNIDEVRELRDMVKQKIEKLDKVLNSIDNSLMFSLIITNEFKVTRDIFHNLYCQADAKLSQLDNVNQKGQFFKLSTHDELWKNRAQVYNYLI